MRHNMEDRGCTDPEQKIKLAWNLMEGRNYVVGNQQEIDQQQQNRKQRKRRLRTHRNHSHLPKPDRGESYHTRVQVHYQGIVKIRL
jgi:hypothetical protein